MPETAPSLAFQRQNAILASLRQDGAVRVRDLASALRVSTMTVRRDLDTLARRGSVTKVHGGATQPDNRAPLPRGFNSKPTLEAAWEASIARTAAGLVEARDVIALSADSATAALACALVSTPDLTVVTNSTFIADTLKPSPDLRRTVVLTGGSRAPSGALVGPVAERAIRSLHVNTLFTGCSGMDPDGGLTTPNLSESELNREFVRAAHRIVLLADHTKWGMAGLSQFAVLGDVDVLVCDAGLDAEDRAVAAQIVGRVLIAEEGQGSSRLDPARRPDVTVWFGPAL